jgi:predicted CoA-substrate-specific enzyme activase
MAFRMGIDVGSSATKGVVTDNGAVVASHAISSGFDYRAAARRLRDELLDRAGLTKADVERVVATGLGSGSVDFADIEVADIRCCARGVARSLPTARTVIDIQAQTTRVLRLSAAGRVTDFIVSEKCASGSGCFLDIIANVLQVELSEIGPLSLRSRNPVSFTTGCAVFAESEAVSRVAEGVPKEDILAGVNRALADKIAALVQRVGLEERCALSGGGALNVGLERDLAERLGRELLTPPNPRCTTALGAAVLAEGEVEDE